MYELANNVAGSEECTYSGPKNIIICWFYRGILGDHGNYTSSYIHISNLLHPTYFVSKKYERDYKVLVEKENPIHNASDSFLVKW